MPFGFDGSGYFSEAAKAAFLVACLQCLSALMGVVTQGFTINLSANSPRLQCLSALMGVVTPKAIQRFARVKNSVSNAFRL